MSVHLDCLEFDFRVWLREFHAIRFGIAHDRDRGQEAGHVAGRLGGQATVDIPESVQVADLLAADQSLYPVLAAVVAGQRHHPVAEHPVQIAEVVNRSIGRLFRVHPLVDQVAAIEAVSGSGGRDELPHSQGASRGQRAVLEAALDERKPAEFFGKSRLTKLAYDHGSIASRALIRLDKESAFGAGESRDLPLDVVIDLQRDR